MRLAPFCLVAALCALSALGQNITGSFTGAVTDPSGASVAGAEVTATNLETNQATAVKTNHLGVYQALSLRPGPYSIKRSRRPASRQHCAATSAW
ncbi:MAG: carboxypeptidase regulatory-like domain-containing protein [Acidobacteria bacterium]|nr:carboxypeptidase regulatory-like domain-containing protein [Acidobacteriota bacterium]